MNPNQKSQSTNLPQQVVQPQSPVSPPAGMPVVEIPVSPEAQHAKSNPNSTQNALLISEVRDGIVIMSDGSFRAVIMCKSINFDLMSPEEREAVEFSYQGFLNSLYFPIQIFIRSQKVDIRPYLDKLNKTRSEQDNMLLGLLMEDYVAFLGDIAQQTNIMDKKFYLVVRYPDLDENVRSTFKQSTGFFTGMLELFGPGKNPHVVIDEAALEKAKTELRNRVQAILQGLSQCGVQALPLDTQELIELYYDAYNPDTATRQQLKNFDEISAPLITKGEGNAPQPDSDREQL
jgi:type IV secretory pathway VirB4 component